MAFTAESLVPTLAANTRRGTIVIGVLGCGTVGGGVVARLLERGRIAGSPARLGRILVRDLSKARAAEVLPYVTTNAADILDDPTVDIVVETIGGTTIARELVEAALSRGKHVVTANKALVAAHGRRLARLAREHHAAFRYEAAVGGAVPVVRALAESLADERILEIAGIVNGTSNAIIEAMTAGADFETALQSAQDAGFAEPDPTNDVDGWDAAQKLAVLANHAFTTAIDVDRVVRVSLRSLVPEDFALAKRLGMSLAPLAYIGMVDDRLEAIVAPVFVRADHDFARTSGPGNFIRVTGSDSGPLGFCGPGAGRAATASAVFGDLADIARKLARWEYQGAECLADETSPVAQARFPMLVRTAPGDASAVAQALDAEVLGDDAVLVRSKTTATEVELALRSTKIAAKALSIRPCFES